MLDPTSKSSIPRIDELVGRRLNKQTGEIEYRAKFQDLSHLHTKWMGYDEAQLFLGDTFRDRMRIQGYERKLKREGYTDIEDADDLDISAITPDRILSHKQARLPTLSERLEPWKTKLPPIVYPRVTSAFLYENSDQVKQRFKFLIDKLMIEPDSEPFRHPVDIDDVPDYLDYIVTPMDLGTILGRLSREAYYIGACLNSMIANDVRLVFQNCKAYNEEGSGIYHAADELLKTFERHYKDWILCPSAWLEGLVDWKPWEIGCSICEVTREEGDDEMILCDRCDGEYHLDCLDPPLESVPDTEWFCAACTLRQEFEMVERGKASSDKEQDVQDEEKKKKVSKKASKKSTNEVQFPSSHHSEYPMALQVAPSIAVGKTGQSPVKRTFETVYLVKWLGLSYRLSTWEIQADIEESEQIERYHKFNQMPSPAEIRKTVCQLPCCANLLKTSTATQNSCLKDKFCILGYFHSGNCSRQLTEAESGSKEFLRQRMVDQIRAQLYAYYQIMNNRDVDDSLLKQCGLYTTGFTLRQQYFPKDAKDRDEYDVNDEDSSSSEEEDDDDDPNDLDYDDAEVVYHARRESAAAAQLAGANPSAGATGNNNPAANGNENNEDEIHEEVTDVMGAMIEHIALSKPLPPLIPVIPSTVLYSEYSAIIKKSQYGLGMRLGLTDDGMVRVIGFQRTPIGGIGPAEATRLIGVGDHIVMVNQQNVVGLPFNFLIDLISKSPGFVMIRFRTGRRAMMFPKFCEAREISGLSPPSVYVPYPSEDSPVHVGLEVDERQLARLRGPAMLQRLQDYAPTGPVQHLCAAVCDNSVNILEHFRAFLPPQLCVQMDEEERLRKEMAEEEEELEDGVAIVKESSKADEFIPYEKSPTFKGSRTLREYQVEGLNWMISCYKQRRSCILADEMGLGKTVQIVSTLEHLRTEENIRGPFLIVVPLSTIQHWRREVEDWTDMNVCVYHDIGEAKSKATAKDMRSYIRQMEWYYPEQRYSNQQRGLFKFNILLTTFETILADFEEFEPIHWRLIVVDEAHRLKNTNSKALKLMRTLRVDRRILLTGTPLQNNTQELFVLMNYLEPTVFDDLEEFMTKYGKLHSQEQVIQLQKMIAPYILRRIKEEVEKSIPPKEETIVEVELTTMQKRYYRAIYEKNRSYLYKGLSGSGLPSLQNVQIQLRKCCNHPFLIEGARDRELEMLGDDPTPEEIMKTVIDASGKCVLVSKLLPKLKQEGHKVLIFSQFLKQIDIIEQYCESQNFGCERLDGSVSGHDRQQSIDRFSRPNSKSFVFLLSTKAGGVGINLTAADTCIIYDSDWNPQNDLQAQARCHRIGQQKPVKIYRLVTRNTFESEMFARSSRKLGLEHAILGTANFDETTSSIDQPSPEELEALLRRGAYGLADDDDSAFRAFAERDIDEILKENAHVRIVEGSAKQTAAALGANASEKSKKASGSRRATRKSASGGGKKMKVDRSSFVTEGADNDLSVDDPNFWEKVLSINGISVEMLGLKLHDGSALETDETKMKFITDLQAATQKLIEDANSNATDATATSLSTDHTKEYDLAIQLWQMVLMKKRKHFTEGQKEIAHEMMDVLHGSRVRSCRQTTQDELGSRSRRQSGVSGGGGKKKPTRGGGGGKKKTAAQKKKLANAQKIQKAATYNDKTDELCALCGDGGLILLCDGPCHRSFHLECVGLSSLPEESEKWLCPDCVAGRHMCLICNQIGNVGTEKGVLQCSEGTCGRFYHRKCLLTDKTLHVQWLGKKRFICPQHFCSICLKPEDKRKYSTAAVLSKCTHCPVSVHLKCLKEDEPEDDHDDTPATIQVLRLSKKLMICSKHLDLQLAHQAASPAKVTPKSVVGKKKKNRGKTVTGNHKKKKKVGGVVDDDALDAEDASSSSASQEEEDDDDSVVVSEDEVDEDYSNDEEGLGKKKGKSRKRKDATTQDVGKKKMKRHSAAGRRVMKQLSLEEEEEPTTTVFVMKDNCVDEDPNAKRVRVSVKVSSSAAENK